MLSVLRRPLRWHGSVSLGLGLPLLLGVDPAAAAGAIGAAPGIGASVSVVAGAWALIVAGGVHGTALQLGLCGVAAGAVMLAWLCWPARGAGAGAGARSGARSGVAGFGRVRLRVAGLRRLRSRPTGRAAPAAPAAPLPRSALALPSGLTRDDVVAAAMRDFIRLQAAWDARDLATLRHLTLPQMLDELLGVLALHEGAPPRRTDVLTLHADLLACDAVGPDFLASIEFSGLIRESPDAGAAPFRELWMLIRSAGENPGWRLARQQSLL